jgi:ketosteroid isomerase-like protein
VAGVSQQKRVIEQYIEGFRNADHEAILALLTDDVIWEMPGLFRLEGKVAFDGEIENPAFSGKPKLTIHRMTEEGNVVVLEGRVQAAMADGTPFAAEFCDVFEFEEEKIKRLIGFLSRVNE